MSYLQIKKFVDKQIKLLNTPIVVNDRMKRLLQQESLLESQVKSVLFKCNLLIKRHNRIKYTKQVVHQIVQQVTKAEQENLTRVNEALEKVSRLVQPVLTHQFAGSGRLEDRITLLNDLADVLPEGRYLFAIKEDEEKPSGQTEEDAADSADVRQDLLVRDNEELVRSPDDTSLREQDMEVATKQLEKHIGPHKEKRTEFRQRYDDLRSQLASLNENVVYKMEKLAYLKELNEKMNFSKTGARRSREDNDSDGDIEEDDNTPKDCQENDALGPQISRFKVLVEKLEFALSAG